MKKTAIRLLGWMIWMGSMHAYAAVTINVPEHVSTVAGQSLALTNGLEISIYEPLDAGDQVTVAVGQGTLTLSGTAGLAFSVGDGTADTTMTFSGTTAAVNTALDGMTYTPPVGYAGRLALTIGVTGVQTGSGSVSIAVNKTMDTQAARAQILSGVTQVSTYGTYYFGHMAVYGKTAFSVGHNGSYRPIIAGATWGQGNVLAFGRTNFNDFQNNSGGDMDTLYLNAVRWASGTTDTGITVVVNDPDTVTWLLNKGYSNSSYRSDWENYASGADLLIILVPENPSQAQKDAIATLVSGGGGLIATAYGEDWVDPMTAGANKLFQETGLGWSDGRTTEVSDPWTLAVSTDYANTAKAALIAANPAAYTTAQKDECGASLKEISQVATYFDWPLQTLNAELAVYYSPLYPSPTTPVSDSFQMGLLDFEGRFLMTTPPALVTAHRTAGDHGITTAQMPRVNKSVTVEAPPQNDLRADVSGVGLYVPAGERITITVPANVVNNGLEVWIGHQRDVSDAYNVMPGPIWKFPVTSTTMEMASAYGGLLFFYFPTGYAPASFAATVEGCIEAPRFVLGQTTDAEWVTNQRGRPGPSAEFLGTNHRLIVPTDTVQDLEKPNAIMQLRDDVYTRMYYVAGYDRPDEVQNIFWSLEVLTGVSVNPLYPSADESSHLLPKDYLDISHNWIYIHEPGHRIDNGATMVHSGQSEAYNNMIGIYGIEVTSGNPVIKQYAVDEGMRTLYEDYIESTETWEGAPHSYSRSKTTFGTLLGETFGWEIMRNYSVLALANPPVDDQARTDGWLTHWSQAVGYDLSPYFQSWKLSPSPTAINSLAALPDWNMMHLVDESVTVFQNSSIVLRDPLSQAFSYDGVIANFALQSPAHGSAVRNANGTITYTPAGGYAGPDTITYTVQNGLGNVFMGKIDIMVIMAAHSPKLRTGTIAAAGTETWTPVTLPETYASMVVVATPTVEPGLPPMVTRIRNAVGNGFEVKIQRADGLTDPVEGVTVRYVVVEEGVYTKEVHGVRMEAKKFISTVTASAGNLVGQDIKLLNSPTDYDDLSVAYRMPVLIGQVMSANDPGWSVFWAQRAGGTLTYTMGKHVGDDPSATRANETIGYIAMEHGHTQIGNVRFWGDSAGMWDTDYWVDGVNEGGTRQAFEDLYVGAYDITAAMAGSFAMAETDDLYWPVLYGTDAITSAGVTFALDEDTFADSERSHGANFISVMMFSGVLVAQNDRVQTVGGSAIVIDPVANDYVRDSGDPLSLASYTSPQHGILTYNAGSGDLTYTPYPGYFGVDYFTYTAEDGNGNTAEAKVAIDSVAAPVSHLNGTNLSWEDDGSNYNQVPTGWISDCGTKFRVYGTGTWFEDSTAGTQELLIDFTYSTGTLKQQLTGTGAAGTYTYTIFDAGIGWASVANGGGFTFGFSSDGVNFDLGQGSYKTLAQGSELFVPGTGPAYTGSVTCSAEATDTIYLLYKATLDDGRTVSTVGSSTLEFNTSQPPAFTADPFSTSDATEDVAYSGTIAGSATDPENDPLTYSKFAGPAWLNVSTNGVLSGTPTHADAGLNTFIVAVHDNHGAADSATLNITVASVNVAPVFTADSFSTANATENAAYSDTIAGSATDGDAGDTLTYSKVSGPAWLAVASDGALSGTPANSDVGLNSWTVEVSDGTAAPVSATLNITVTNVNDAPVAADDTASVTEDGSVVIPVLANDTDPDAGDTLNVQSVTQGTNGSVTNNGTNVTYVPNANFNGSDAFTYTVSDGNGGTDEATVSVTVTPASDEPTAQKASSMLSAFFEGNEIYDGSIYTNGWTEVTPTHTSETLNGTDLNRTQTGTGAAWLEGQNSTKATSTWATANDGDWTFETRMRVNASPNGLALWLGTGAARIIVEIHDNRTQDYGGNGFNAADTNNDGAFHTWRITHDSAFGRYYVWRDGVLLTPAPGISYDAVAADERMIIGDYTSGTFGNLQNIDIDYIAYDQTGAYAPQSNQAPVAADDSAMVAEEGSVVIDVLANDTDPDAGDTLSVESVTQGSSGTVVNNGADVTYTPGADFHGDDVFSYVVSDGKGGADTATVQVSVTPVNDAPVFTVDPISAADASEGVAYSATIAGSATDADAGDTLAYSKVSGAGWLSVASDGTLSGTPANSDVGLNVFTVQVSDGHGGTDTATLNITVVADSVPPAAPAGLSATEGIGSVALDWADNTEADLASYSVYRSATSGGGYVAIATGVTLSGYTDSTAANHTTYYYVVTAVDDNANESGYSAEVSAVPGLVGNWATGQIAVAGTVTGTLNDSALSDNAYQTVTEVLSGNTSLLEHKWVFNVTGAELVTFYVEAHHTANSEGDDFVFAYSTNDVDYTDMVTVSKTADDDLLQYFPMPGGLSGTVYVRVRDADRTDGRTQLDTISIDELFIVSEESSAAPGAASAPSPADSASQVAVNAPLSWTAGLMSASHDVYFGTSSTPAFQGNQTGTTFDPGALAHSTTYYWRVNEVNNSGTTVGPVWSFATEAAPGPVVVFTDNFETSANWTSEWSAVGAWARVTAKAHDGSYSAEIDGNVTDSALVSRSIDVTGKSTATITFWWLIEGSVDAGEYLAFDVDAGAGWVEKATRKGNVDAEDVWASQSIMVDVSGTNTLTIRFRGKMNQSSEDAYVDQVEVSAQ